MEGYNNNNKYNNNNNNNGFVSQDPLWEAIPYLQPFVFVGLQVKKTRTHMKCCGNKAPEIAKQLFFEHVLVREEKGGRALMGPMAGALRP